MLFPQGSRKRRCPPSRPPSSPASRTFARTTSLSSTTSPKWRCESGGCDRPRESAAKWSPRSMNAIPALRRFRAGAPFRPWVLQIVANEARNRRRSAGRRAQLAMRAAAQESSGGAAPSPEASLLDAERRDALLAAVNDLPEDQREVIALRYFAELSEEETATALELPRGTVKSRTARALERLRESYD